MTHLSAASVAIGYQDPALNVQSLRSLDGALSPA